MQMQQTTSIRAIAALTALTAVAAAVTTAVITHMTITTNRHHHRPK